MKKNIRIGTRESQLAVWQAEQVKSLLAQYGYDSELVYIKSEGDIDLITPLYKMGVQGVFTRSLDIALLNDKIDIAVHSMKDVPTQLANGIVQSAILKRASYKDLFVYKESSIVNGEWSMINEDPAKFNAIFTIHNSPFTIATSSIRRKAQWLNRYPNHTIENLRGNVNTRLKKVEENTWNGAVFAAAGLERINLRPKNSIELDWMLPAPAQGAIMVVCREEDKYCLDACSNFNDADTAMCVKIERDFLRTLLGGCSTPISALAQINNGEIILKGNILSLDGKDKVEVEMTYPGINARDMGILAAHQLLNKGGQSIADSIRNETK
jgi:hydroxymethylbilane synthase